MSCREPSHCPKRTQSPAGTHALLTCPGIEMMGGLSQLWLNPSSTLCSHTRLPRLPRSRPLALSVLCPLPGGSSLFFSN